MKGVIQNREAPVYFEYPSPLVLRLRPAIDLTADQLLEISSLNGDLRLEMTAEGDLMVMPPAGGETSGSNAGLTAQVWTWARSDGTGRVFDSSGGFVLPDGAILSPDASWVRRERLDALTAEQRKKFLPLCPDFVIELRSPSDRLGTLQAKMREYLENGARLGWLLDPESKCIHVYEPNESVRVLENPEKLSGGAVLPGFVLNLREVW